MKTQSTLKTISTGVAFAVLGASPVVALDVGIPQIPEPSSLSIYGLAVAGLVIAYRIRNRK